MYLFDKKERIKDVAERGSLPLYDFFDKYNNDKHNKIRDFLNKSFSQYNEENQKRIYDEIIKNKSSDEKFYSTCFELIAILFISTSLSISNNSLNFFIFITYE